MVFRLAVLGPVMEFHVCVRRNGADTLSEHGDGSVAQFLCVLSFFALAQRYAADLCRSYLLSHRFLIQAEWRCSAASRNDCAHCPRSHRKPLATVSC